MDNIEHTKAPRSAIHLYVKLYWKKRNQKSKIKSKKLLFEATKSWLSLSEAEKLEFTNKFNECKALFRNKVANQLKNSKPYLKKKRILNSKNVFRNNIVNSEQLQDSNLNYDENRSQISAAENNPIDSSNHHPTYDEILNESKVTEDVHPAQQEVISEPTPPALLSGQELFNMIEKNTDKTWLDLLPAQRRQYQYAILTIKKNYLKQYRSYLENLSAIKLVEHYKNMKNEPI